MTSRRTILGDPSLKSFWADNIKFLNTIAQCAIDSPAYKSKIPTEEDIRRRFEENKKAANKMLAPMKVEITGDTTRFVGDKWPVMQHVGNEWRMQLEPWMKGSEKAFKENIARFKIYSEVAEEVRAGKYQSVSKVQGEIVNRMVAYEFATRNATTQPATSP